MSVLSFVPKSEIYEEQLTLFPVKRVTLVIQLLTHHFQLFFLHHIHDVSPEGIAEAGCN